MDRKSEDTMVRQIEENLTNHLDDNLFMSGRDVENKRTQVRKTNISDRNKSVINNENQDYPLVSNDYINCTNLTRAEYIRQAREACLRQLSDTQLYSRPYEVNYMESDHNMNEQLNQKRSKVMNLFNNGSGAVEQNPKEPTTRISAAYRSFLIRSACAIVLFISVFLIDKFNIEDGKLYNKTIEEYVTGNDVLQDLENMIVTWLK